MDSNYKNMDLWDFLIVVAENLKFLVLAPLLVAGVALMVVSLKAELYKSDAVLLLQPDDQIRAASMLVSPQVLNGVIAQLNLDLSLAEFGSMVSVSRSRDGLLRLSVTADSPQAARERASVLISVWRQSSSLDEDERLELEKKLDQIRRDYDKRLRLLEGLAFARNDKTGTLVRPEMLSKLMEAELNYSTEMLRLSKILIGIPESALIMQPTLPEGVVNAKNKLVFIAALLAAIGLSLLWVLILNAWKTASLDPELSDKQTKLLALLRCGAR